MQPTEPRPNTEVLRRIDQWRRRLLDLSSRNGLINFRASKAGTLHLVEPDFRALFDRLVDQEETLTFALAMETEPDPDPTDTPPTIDGISEESSVAAEQASGPLPARIALRPGEVRPDGDPRKHKAVLYRLRLRARGSLDEQGVNTLFVAFGMLEWKESEASSDVLRSPLLLVPVSLQRDTALDPFQLSLIEDEEIVLNPTLAERLRKDFGIELPIPERNGADLDLDDVLKSVAATVRSQRSWRVVEDAYLGCFSFLKLAMYQDLQANSNLMAEHPLIRAIAGNLEALPPAPSDLPSTDELDEKLPPARTFHILNADSSQLEAIAAAIRGVNLIVQGPPGTGKSQTIANLIAESLAQGKRVLFVSEKMAALEVVYRRLAQCGLGSLCLKLHDHKAKKKAVIDQLAESLEEPTPRQPAPNTLITLEQLAQRRTALNRYVRALHDENTGLGISVFRAHGEIARRESVPDLPFTLPGMETVAQAQLAKWIDHVERLKTLDQLVLNQKSHPWCGCKLDSYSLQLQSEIQSHFSKLRGDLNAGETEGAVLAAAIGLEAPTTVQELRQVGRLLGLMSNNPIPPKDWFTSSTLAPVLESARSHSFQSEEYHQRRESILAVYSEGILTGQTPELYHRLTDKALSGSQLFGFVTEGARETASKERKRLERSLMQTAEALDTIISTASSMASRAGLSVPATIDDAAFGSRVVGILLQDPRPLREWLDCSRLISGRKLAVEAHKHSKFSRLHGTKLRELYDDQLIEEAPGIADRFAGHYASALRVFRPSYWRDMSRLRALHKDHAKHSLERARSVVGLAQEVNKHEAWLRDHEDELARIFGKHRAFGGQDTEWDVVIASVEATLALLNELGEPPRDFVKILLSGGAELTALRGPQGAVSSALDSLKAALEELARYVNTDQLVPYGEAPSVGRELVGAVLAALRDFWAAETAVRALLREPGERSVAELISGAREAVELMAMAERLKTERDGLIKDFGHFFADFDTNWDAVFGALVWTEEVKSLFESSSPPPAFVRRASGVEAIEVPSHSRLKAFENVLEGVSAGLQYVTTVFDLSEFTPAGKPYPDAPLVALLAWLDERLKNLVGLQEWIDFKRLLSECATEGLAGFVAELERFSPKPEQWTDVFLKRFYQIWLDDRYAEVNELGAFRGANHDTAIQDFRRLDREALRAAPSRVRHAVLSRRPAIDVGGIRSSEPAVLYHEIGKRKRHKPIRRLFREIPNLLLTLKPCLLMSPLSVSSYLDAARIQFDVIIFDEASQVLPEDAVGAVFRGRQLVVAGDNKQLPPTDFFKAHSDESDEEDDPEEEEILDSILDQCGSLGLPSVMLKWHYRSRDEQLIAFSNRHFYRNKLITFPNSYEKAPGRGVEFIHVPDGIYDRGGTRTNRVEARRVVDLIMEHAEQRPEETLGVVAFSRAQWLAIHQEWEARRRLRSDLEDFFKEDKDEPFFIKNLEEIQGDERDVIIFSMGYGKDYNGKMVSTFGPVNRVGGERRLNVAVTRARNHVKFVASVMPEDIDLSGSSSEGARLLLRYMEYAIRGRGALDGGVTDDGGEPESPFEEAVLDELRRRGLAVKSQVGCSGYRIDIGVLDDKNPNRFILGVECDGATYHSSRTARDRDRLRQQILEGLGWQIHRVWSQDWVKDSEREIQRVLEAVARARLALPSVTGGIISLGVARTPEAVTENMPSPRLPVAPKPQPKRAVDRTEPYREARLPSQSPPESLYDYWTARTVVPSLVASCVQVESPVHVDRVIGALAGCWGFQRAGNRIAEVVNLGIAIAETQKKVVRRGDFLCRPDMTFEQVPVRRPGAGQRPRPIDWVALDELEKAVLFVVEESFSLPLDGLVAETSRILGYERTGIHISTRIREAIDLLERHGKILDTDGMISRPAQDHSAG